MRKVIVVGGGPGGYVAAIRAAELGAEVTLIEKDALGGTCLNRGCVPTKVLLHSVNLYREIMEGRELGLLARDVELDWNVLQKRKSDIVSKLQDGIKYLMKKNKIEVIKGVARFVTHNQVEVENKAGKKQNLTADAFIIATGAEPVVPPVEGFTPEDILTSNEVLAMRQIPSSMAIVGGGVIGIEFASLFLALGVKVSVIERMPEILPNLDAELVGILKKRLEAKGGMFYTNTNVKKMVRNLSAYIVSGENVGDGKSISSDAEKVFVCVGRQPVTSSLDLEKTGVQTERGRIVVNERMQTCVPAIYAIGDCCSPVMLAHVASAEGRAAAENIMGKNSLMRYDVIPSCLYTAPEMASVGLTAEQAIEKGYDTAVARYSLAGNAKSKIMNQADGMIKIVSDKRYGEVLGVHIYGPRATDIIAEGALAIRNEITANGIAATIHAHPTLSEAMGDAVTGIIEA